MKNQIYCIIFILLCSKPSLAKNTSDVTSLPLYKDSSVSNYSSTKTAYSDAYLTNSYVSEIYLNRGLYKLRAFDCQSAIENFQKVLSLNPGSFEAYCYLGDALELLNRTTEAMKAYDRAIDLNPFYATAYMKRGDLLKKNGLFSEAYENYSIALYIDPIFVHGFSGNTIDELTLKKIIPDSKELVQK